jgi:allophanate hydrolase
MTTLPELTTAYAGGARVADVIAEIRAAVDPTDPVWISTVSEAALAERARSLDAAAPEERARRPLFGVPFAVKDNIDVAGLPTTAGCPAFAFVPGRSATAVQRLEDAGAVLVGKTNLDQFATGLVGTRSPYGIPTNPFGAAYIPGGSSSGSAVAVARGLVTFALGTDTAGSGRVPAAFTATVGIKPTHGLISTAGVLPACRSLDCVSIFARSVADARAVFEVAAGPDVHDAFSRRAPDRQLPPPPTFRFAVPLPEQQEFFGDVQARRTFETALERLASIGGYPVSVDLTPCFAAAELLYNGPFVAERTAAVGDFIDANPDAVLEVTRSIIASGRRYSAVDAFRAQYRIQELRAAVQAIFSDITLLAVPSTPTIYTRADIAAEPYACNARLGMYTNFVNLLDLCAIAIPSGWYDTGLPIGVTLIGPAFSDAALGHVATRFLNEDWCVHREGSLHDERFA